MNLYGKNNLLDQPEFAEDAKKLRKVLGLLDDPKAFREALEGSTPSDKVGLLIGSGEHDDLTILTANISIPGGQNASISLLGPKRMDYEKAMSTLEYVSKTLDEFFAQEGGETCQNQKKKPN